MHLAEMLPSIESKRHYYTKKNSHQKTVDQECQGPLPKPSEFQSVKLAQQLRLTRRKYLHRLECNGLRFFHADRLRSASCRAPLLRQVPLCGTLTLALPANIFVHSSSLAGYF